MTEIEEPGLPTPASIQRTYLLLLLGNTLAASLIWGINTIFLLDAGLSNLEAFAANAFFTAGMVMFEVPTGIVADTIGRRTSYLLGTVTLATSTLLYVLLWQIEAPFWAWAVVSMLLGLGFTFFSGAVEAWLVDALKATGSRAASSPSSAGGRSWAGRRCCRVGCRRLHRPGHEPRCPVRAAGSCSARCSSSRSCSCATSASRRRRDGVAEGDPADRGRLDRLRLAGAGGEVDDAGVPVHGGRRLLRLLRPAALSPRALRRPGGYGIAGLVAAIVAGAQILGGLAAPGSGSCSIAGPRRSSLQPRPVRRPWR